MPYTLKVRLGEDVETVQYLNRGRMIAEATHYAEEGYIVKWEEGE